MRVVMFSTKLYDRRSFDACNHETAHDITFLEPRLDETTAVLATGYPAVCAFVNDQADAAVLAILASGGTRILALRSAGYNHVDLAAARELGIAVVRVPAYSPHAVAEFTIGLLLSLDRKIHRAWARVRENNFSLDGLLGQGLFGKTIGVVGTGRIGNLVARTLRSGFGCDVLASDIEPARDLEALGVRYVTHAELLSSSDIVTLHCPLNPDTHHLVDAEAIAAARPGFLLVNTSRGALVDAGALIEGLKARQVGGVALDVYEQEGDLFFEDLSSEIIQDDVFQRLLTFPNVLVTGHQAFFTEGALQAIAQTTLGSLSQCEAGEELTHAL
ncbi:MAG: 2-hydroxyacid dehydrogenase, partial [Microvirga sp.]